MSEEEIKELLKIEKEKRELVENLMSAFEMILKHNVPERIGTCLHLLKPIESFKLALSNSPTSFSNFPECFNTELSDDEKYKLYKDRKPFIKAICKHCRK